MDAQEFAEWIAYSRLDPFGNERQDLNAAAITSMIYNANRGKGASKSPKDFLWDFDGSAHSPAALQAKMRANLRGGDG